MSVPYKPAGSIQNPTTSMGTISDVPDSIEMRPVQLFAEDGAPSRGLLYRRRGATRSVGIHVMHQRADLYNHYSILPLAMAGYSVLAHSARWPNNDVSTVHELLLLDMAAGLNFLTAQGCERVILLGPAGGGSLAAFYQAQAEAAKGTRLRETPAGDPLDLNRFDLPEAAGVVLFGAHIGQGAVLGKMIDPAVVDEFDPLATDPDLDMYNPANGFVMAPASSSYSADFLRRYRAAQLLRVKRIDARARALLTRQRQAATVVESLRDRATREQVRASIVEHHLIVYRTTADPACVDLSIDPDDRLVGSYHNTRPDLENYGAEGFSRVTTPRAWLSTWSALSSNALTVPNLTKVHAPVFITHHAGDAETRMNEVREMLDVTSASDKQLHIVRGVEHSGFFINKAGSRGARTTEGVDVLRRWLEERFP